MLNLIFHKDDSPFWGAPQENDAKFRFAIHPQGIGQFHDNCQIAECQTVTTLVPVYRSNIKDFIQLLVFLVPNMNK